MVERKVADTILEKTEQVEVGGVMYDVAPPSTATLIRVSELVASMPYIDVNTRNILHETLRVAKDLEVLGEIAATLILGVKKERSKLFDILPKRKKVTVKQLTGEILALTPQEMRDIISKRLEKMEVGFFFGISISLSEVNLLKPTKTESESNN